MSKSVPGKKGWNADKWSSAKLAEADPHRKLHHPNVAEPDITFEEVDF